MRMGYGRGYYGDRQQAPKLRRGQKKKGIGWFPFLAAAGIGAFVWFTWPRDKTTPASPQLPGTTPPQLPAGDPALPEPRTPIEQLAHSRGFPSVEALENSIVESARSLRASGAMVHLAPYFEYLAPRLEGS